MSEYTIAQGAIEELGAITDEDLRKALVQASGAWFLLGGASLPGSVDGGRRMGAIFDTWLAKRDMDIYDQAYAHGFMEGSGE